jgi:tetratricopeptide (TPR) repeat protein
MPFGAEAVDSSQIRRVWLKTVVLAVLWLLLPVSASANKAELARALSLYNDRRFDEAIVAATQARKSLETQDPAAVVLARAHLERYRERVDPADLAAAREALGAVRTTVLEPRVRLEYLVALGQALFLEDEFGAAAVLFSSALKPARGMDARLGDAVADWWGSAAERQADLAPPEVRRARFLALADGMRGELGAYPESSAAAYWLAAALRGAGEPDAAWDAATAGWVRARMAGGRSAVLRADLDKLVLQGIIPDRVRNLEPDDRALAASQLRADWELIKQRWR